VACCRSQPGPCSNDEIRCSRARPGDSFLIPVALEARWARPGVHWDKAGRALKIPDCEARDCQGERSTPQADRRDSFSS